MKTQYENRIVSSFVLWLDHTMLEKGEAFTNFGSDFFPINSLYQGYNTWGAPFKQFVSDSSIPGVQVPNGLHVSGSFTLTGVYPLVDISYNGGQAYFSNPIDNDQVSGDYSVKDFSVYLTNKAEQELLFETKISVRNSTAQEVTGLAPNVQTYPAIFIKNNGGFNQPFTFGGQERTEVNLRAVVLADSQFNLDAACSILKDTARSNVPVFTDEKYPFNTLGGLKNGVYNYDNIVDSLSDNVFIRNVDVSRYNLGYMEGFSNSNPDVFRAIIDFELEDHRYPRS